MEDPNTLKKPLLEGRCPSDAIELTPMIERPRVEEPRVPTQPVLQNQQPIPSQSQPMQNQQAQNSVIKCSGCPLILAYPPGSYCVKCPECHVATATMTITHIRCPYCGIVLMCPAESPYVCCPCGRMMGNPALIK